MFIAVGEENGDTAMGTRHGFAKLYTKSGSDWNFFQQINGTESTDEFGISLDLSHDGSILIVGSSNDVAAYGLSNTNLLYELLYIFNDSNGNHVSVSGDGMVVGITSYISSTGIRIFERIGDGFQQRGTDISGYSGDVALNYNGTIAIFGDPEWDSDTGRTAVFQWRGDEDGLMQWIQMGSDITGDAADDDLGCDGCVSITYDGLTVAVGADGYGRDGLSARGLVRVYNYDSIRGTWKQSGIDLVGDDSFDEFSRTALSSDGTYLIVAANRYVKVFEKNGNVSSSYPSVFSSITPSSSPTVTPSTTTPNVSPTSVPTTTPSVSPRFMPTTTPSVSPTFMTTTTPSVPTTKLVRILNVVSPSSSSVFSSIPYISSPTASSSLPPLYHPSFSPTTPSISSPIAATQVSSFRSTFAREYVNLYICKRIMIVYLCLKVCKEWKQL